MASEFVASLRHRIRHSRMDPSRARYRELSRLDTRRDWEFHSCTRTSAWKRSENVPTRQERDSDWSCYSGHRSATTGRQHQRTTSGFPHTRFSTGAARSCHCCPSSSPPTIVCRDSGRQIPGPVCAILLILGIITGGIATGSWMRRRGGSPIRATSPGTTRKYR